MARLFLPSTESIIERYLVGACALLIHVLLAWWFLQVMDHGTAGAGGALQGDGDALVVDFIAVPSMTSSPRAVPLPVPQELTAAEQLDPTISLDTLSPKMSPTIAPPLSDLGEYTPDPASKPTTQLPSQSASASSAAKGGSPENDLLANYHAALRARIAKTWRELTDRAFPAHCTLHLTQSAGGAVTATSANGCALSSEDRLQLEAAALMAQPLPYAGYESVFAQDLNLVL